MSDLLQDVYVPLVLLLVPSSSDVGGNGPHAFFLFACYPAYGALLPILPFATLHDLHESRAGGKDDEPDNERYLYTPGCAADALNINTFAIYGQRRNSKQQCADVCLPFDTQLDTNTTLPAKPRSTNAERLLVLPHVASH
jgi:hypothetical protein